MEDIQPEVVKPATEKKTTEKLPYEPPKAVFVPLKLEERLLGCGKTDNGNPSGHCKSGGNWHS